MRCPWRSVVRILASVGILCAASSTSCDSAAKLLCMQEKWPNGTEVPNVPGMSLTNVCGPYCNASCSCAKYQYHGDCYAFHSCCEGSSYLALKSASGGSGCMNCVNGAVIDPRIRVQEDKAKCEAKTAASARAAQKAKEDAAAAAKALQDRGKVLCPPDGECPYEPPNLCMKEISMQLVLAGIDAVSSASSNAMTATTKLFRGVLASSVTGMIDTTRVTISADAEQPTADSLTVTLTASYWGKHGSQLALIERRMKKWVTDPEPIFTSLKGGCRWCSGSRTCKDASICPFVEAPNASYIEARAPGTFSAFRDLSTRYRCAAAKSSAKSSSAPSSAPSPSMPSTPAPTYASNTSNFIASTSTATTARAGGTYVAVALVAMFMTLV